jgi:hypothetical protein
MMSAIPSSEPTAVPLETTATETDSIPRIRIRDIMLAVQGLGRNEVSTLEELRLKLNLDRDVVGRTTNYNYTIARDVAAELGKQGCAEVGALPKDAPSYEKKRNMPLGVTSKGRDLAGLLRSDRKEAYATVLRSFHQGHAYFRRFIVATTAGPLLTPVVTSTERHLSPRYTGTRVLAEEVGRNEFDVEGLLAALKRRLDRSLTEIEEDEIKSGVANLVNQSAPAARTEQQSEFARKMLSNLNEIVVPAVLRSQGLGFDFNTLRRLWKMGEEFQVCWATSAHPRFDAWVTFGTATVTLAADSSKIECVQFDRGLNALRDGFLDRLYSVYLKMREWGRPSVVDAWELRAAFCYEHRCAPAVFNKLFEENYTGSDAYEISKDFPRNKPQHEEPLILGGRQIGLIQIIKR